MNKIIAVVKNWFLRPVDPNLVELQAHAKRKNVYLGMTELQQTFIMLRLANRTPQDICAALTISMATFNKVEQQILVQLYKTKS